MNKQLIIMCILFLVLILNGCTASQMNAWSEIAHGLSEASEEYQMGTAKIMNQAMQQLPPGNVSFGSNHSEQYNNYLINTNDGLIYTQCMTLSDGTVICY